MPRLESPKSPKPLEEERMARRHQHLVGAAPALLAASGPTACGGSDKKSSSTGGSSGAKGKTIALLLPETKTTRYEAHDRPDFEAQIKRDCPSCKVIYANATQDPQKQQTQAESALTDGANVLVLDAVDVKSATAIVDRAGQSKVPVIAYDRLIPNADLYAYVSFNNVRQGQIQAQTLLNKLGPNVKGKKVIMINGAPTDPSAGDYKKGAHMAFDRSGVKIVKEYDTTDWSPDKAQREMEQAITAVARTGSSASTRPTTGWPAVPSRRWSRPGSSPARSRSPAATPRWPRSRGSSPATSSARST